MRLFRKRIKQERKSQGWGSLVLSVFNHHYDTSMKRHYWVKVDGGLRPICGNCFPHPVKQFTVNFNIKNKDKCFACEGLV